MRQAKRACDSTSYKSGDNSSLAKRISLRSNTTRRKANITEKGAVKKQLKKMTTTSNRKRYACSRFCGIIEL